MKFLMKLAAGQFGLFKTFWIFGILVNFAGKTLLRFVPLDWTFVFVVPLLLYQCFLVPGIWRAADKYDGALAGVPILAKIYAVFYTVFVIFGVAMLIFLDFYRSASGS